MNVAVPELEVRSEAAVRPGRMLRWWLAAAMLLVLAMGALEDCYGNTDFGDLYGTDAVQYLDIARAIEHKDWHSALNPLWSQGYPALLAAERPLFAAGPMGDWHATRVLNFQIFALDLTAFAWLLRLLIGRIDAEDENDRRRRALLWFAGLGVFAVTQICLGIVSRVNADELVNALFFAACALMVKLLRARNTSSRMKLGAMLGLLLGVGYVVKAIFLMLGCGMLALTAFAIWRRRRVFSPVLVSVVLFASIAGTYGAALSRAVGHFTMGESGAINYAWHVNRLAKWVHWEGGTEPASAAWPKASIAKFAQWDAKRPDFGAPVHPTRVVQEGPRVYEFNAPFHATYAPYFNPPYWYEGYRHIFNWRYQLIALAKSVGDLAKSVATHLVFGATMLALAFLMRRRTHREAAVLWLREHALLAAVAVLGVVIYLPVHLEGRYLAAFLAALCVLALTAATHRLTRMEIRVVAVVLALGISGDLAHYLAASAKNMVHHKSVAQSADVRIGEAIHAVLPAGSHVGVISWQPALQSDWAYVAGAEITAEIATPKAMDEFWKMAPSEREQTLATFRRAGDVALLTQDMPASVARDGWVELNGTGMWMYRL